MSVSAIVLAAGLSTRMGRTKALVNLDGRIFLDLVISNVKASGKIDDVIVVTGADHDEVSPHAIAFVATVAFNPNFRTGLMSSLQAGIRSTPAGCQAALICLVDMPLVKVDSIVRVVDFGRMQSRRLEEALARPFYLGHAGHPCLIGQKFFSDILAQEAADQGAMFLFRIAKEELYRCDVSDPGVVRDFDRPEDLE